MTELTNSVQYTNSTLYIVLNRKEIFPAPPANVTKPCFPVLLYLIIYYCIIPCFAYLASFFTDDNLFLVVPSHSCY